MDEGRVARLSSVEGGDGARRETSMERIETVHEEITVAQGNSRQGDLPTAPPSRVSNPQPHRDPTFNMSNSITDPPSYRYSPTHDPRSFVLAPTHEAYTAKRPEAVHVAPKPFFNSYPTARGAGGSTGTGGRSPYLDGSRSPAGRTRTRTHSHALMDAQWNEIIQFNIN